jgi:hypothetical protein
LCRFISTTQRADHCQTNPKDFGMNYARHIPPLAMATGALLVMMFTISLFTGVNQQFIEVVQPYEAYIAALTSGENWLRVILTIDGLFIAAYWLLGIFLALTLWRDDRKLLLALSVAGISATAILDIIENNEFLMYLESLRHTLAIDPERIQTLMVMSAVKWHFAYFAFLFLGFAFPQETAKEKLTAGLMRYVLLPAGIVVHTLPASFWLLAAHLLRFGLLVAILLLLAGIARKWSTNVLRTS